MSDKGLREQTKFLGLLWWLGGGVRVQVPVYGLELA